MGGSESHSATRLKGRLSGGCGDRGPQWRPQSGNICPIAPHRYARSGCHDGIIVSNHGGRSEDSGHSTIDALPEIVDAVKGRIPILIDSDFRRGTDIVRALCMGATAVCVGRGPISGALGAFGQSGVERVLELMRDELCGVMQQVGAPTIKHLGPSMVRRA